MSVLNDDNIPEILNNIEEVEKQIMKATQQLKHLKETVLRIQNNKKHSLPSSNILSNLTNPAKRIKQDFTYEGGYAVVYTDGACENNGRKGAKAGIGVWFGIEHPLNVSAPVIGKATNNTAEIQACATALRIARENDLRKLCIKTDSQFVINAMTDWIKKWKKNNWTLSTGGPVKNKEDFKKLDELCSLVDVKWEHVRGHCGVQGNEYADRLAVQGANSYES